MKTLANPEILKTVVAPIAKEYALNPTAINHARVMAALGQWFGTMDVKDLKKMLRAAGGEVPPGLEEMDATGRAFIAGTILGEDWEEYLPENWIHFQNVEQRFEQASDWDDTALETLEAVDVEYTVEEVSKVSRKHLGWDITKYSCDYIEYYSMTNPQLTFALLTGYLVHTQEATKWLADMQYAMANDSEA